MVKNTLAEATSHKWTVMQSSASATYQHIPSNPICECSHSYSAGIAL